MHPDDHGRIKGTTYPSGRVPPGGFTEPLIGRPLSWREIVARILARTVVRVVRPKPGDVLVIVGELAGSNTRKEIVYAARRAGCTTAVFVERGALVHSEGRRLASEERGYRETKSYGADKDGPKTNTDRGTWVGTPEDVPDQENASETATST